MINFIFLVVFFLLFCFNFIDFLTLLEYNTDRHNMRTKIVHITLLSTASNRNRFPSFVLFCFTCVYVYVCERARLWLFSSLLNVELKIMKFKCLFEKWVSRKCIQITVNSRKHRIQIQPIWFSFQLLLLRGYVCFRFLSLAEFVYFIDANKKINQSHQISWAYS